nr:hypothetical protein [Amycolatopsis orientalis]
MSLPITKPASTSRPARLLTQNRAMRAIGVWNWTLPALAARLPDGRTQVTCPAASACAQICYARSARELPGRRTPGIGELLPYQIRAI